MLPYRRGSDWLRKYGKGMVCLPQANLGILTVINLLTFMSILGRDKGT